LLRCTRRGAGEPAARTTNIERESKYFHKLSSEGQLRPGDRRASTVESGQTPILILAGTTTKHHEVASSTSGWKVVIPLGREATPATTARPFSKTAPDPAAAATVGGVPLLGHGQNLCSE